MTTTTQDDFFKSVTETAKKLGAPVFGPKAENVEIPPEKDLVNTGNISSTNSLSSDSITFYTALKNSPHFPMMIISIICSFTISTFFYWIGRSLMKLKFESMFEDKLPRYKNLIYSIGTIRNIDTDRLVLQDDMNSKYFTTSEEDGSILINMKKILNDNRIMQSIGEQRYLDPEKVLSKDDLDDDIFSFDEKSGHVTIDFDQIVRDKKLVQSQGEIQKLNVDNVVSQDDLPPHAIATTSRGLEDLSKTDEDISQGVIIFDEGASKKYKRFLKRRTTVNPIKPVVLEVHNNCNLEHLKTLIKKFRKNLIIDLTHFSGDPDYFEQFKFPITSNA